MKNISLLIGFVLFLASCSENNLVTPDPDSGEGVHTTLSLSVAPSEFHKDSLNADKSINTRSVTPLADEGKVNCLWVLQFENQSGKLLKKSYYTVTNLAKLDIVLIPNEAGKTSDLYFVANTSREGLANFYGTETDFQSASEAVVTEIGIITASGDFPSTQAIPMSSSIENKAVGKAGIVGGLSTQLIRMLARVDLTINVSPAALTSFTPSKIRVCNVPAAMEYYDNNNSPIGTIKTPSEDFIAAKTYTAYLPENLRGEDENVKSDITKIGVGKPGATYVELSGAGAGANLGERLFFNLYLGGNMTTNYDIKRNNVYNVTVNLTNAKFSDSRLFYIGSNCYVLPPAPGPNNTVKIPICRANVSEVGIQIPDVKNSGCTASVFWEASPGMIENADRPNGSVVTVSDASCPGGFFTVNAVGEGNAVVVIKKDEKILWSWHIWVTSADLNANTLPTTASGGNIWMDRNLGALAVAGSKNAQGAFNTFVTTAGMLYQWGRKDPFLPAIKTAPSLTTMYMAGTKNIDDNYKTTTAGLSLTNSGDTYLKYNTTAIADATTINWKNQLATSIAFPMLFLNGWSGSTATGTAANTVAGGKDSWGGGSQGDVKSIYDPCPVGWRVPSNLKSSNIGISPWASLTVPPVAGTIVDGTPTPGTPIPPNTNLTTPMFIPATAIPNGAYCDWIASPTFGKYSVSGRRANVNGVLSYPGLYGYYWSGSVGEASAINLNFGNAALGVSGGFDRGGGFNVRCVKEY